MKAVMIYDDFDCAAKTVAMLRRAAGCAGPSEPWDINPWRVDVLRLAAASDEALMEALDAHIIVFVGRRAYSLPTWIEQWLENWVTSRRVADAALGAICGEAKGKLSAQVAPRLARFAARHGVKLITENQVSRESESASLPRARTEDAVPLEQL